MLGSVSISAVERSVVQATADLERALRILEEGRVGASGDWIEAAEGYVVLARRLLLEAQERAAHAPLPDDEDNPEYPAQ